MIARVIARSGLKGLVRNSVVFHLLAAAADEDALQYFEMAKLRLLFSIDSATGSDLDERAAEIAPGTIKRRESLFASGETTLGRTGTTGILTIPAGTLVGAEDEDGQISYRTTVSTDIIDTTDTVTGVPVVALEAGARGNAVALTVVQLLTRVPGLVSVVNPSDFVNGQDREDDESFRARLKLYVQALSRGTVTAIESFALGVQLVDGRRVLFAHVVEPITPSGTYEVYIDDGTGNVDEFEETFLASDDTLINPALGGEINLFTTQKPIRELSTALTAEKNAVPLVRGVDYELNVANGQLELAVALVAGDVVTARYSNFSGLIQETQRVIDGDRSTLLTHPGVRAAGTRAIVMEPGVAIQTLAANVSVRADFDVEIVIEEVVAVLQAYINGLDIGQSVIAAEIIERAMKVDGMFNFQISELSGTFPAVDQFILPNQVARIVSANLQIT